MKSLIALLSFVILTSPLCAQKQNLSFNLQKGSTYFQTMTANSAINQNFGGQSMDIKMTIVGKMSYKVNDFKNNLYSMDVKYESMTMKMGMQGMNMEFSSDKNEGGDQLSVMMSKLLGALTKSPFQIEMTNKGKIQSIKNIDVLFDKMFDEFPSLSPEQKAQLKGQLAQSYGGDAFKSNFEMAMAIYPEKPVAVGEKWIVNSSSKSGMDLKIVSEYLLADATGSINTLKGASKLEVADKNIFTPSNGLEMKFDVSGDMATELKVNKQTGWIEEGKLTQTLKGNAQTKDSPQTPGGMTIPMTIETNMSISGK